MLYLIPLKSVMVMVAKDQKQLYNKKNYFDFAHSLDSSINIDDFLVRRDVIERAKKMLRDWGLGNNANDLTLMLGRHSSGYNESVRFVLTDYDVEVHHWGDLGSHRRVDISYEEFDQYFSQTVSGLSRKQKVRHEA